MAKTKISALTTLADGSIANGDLIPIVDVDDFSQAGSGTTKKVTITSLASAVATAFSGDSPTFVNLTTTGTTTLGDSGDATTVNGTLGVTGVTTLTGNLVANGGTITLGADTNFVLSGGVNGVSFDTDVLSIDATNNRVGVGTTNPAYKLDVYGTANIDDKVTITGALLGGNVVPLHVGNARAATNVEIKIEGVVNKAARINFVQSGVSKWLIGNGAASEDNHFVIFNGTTGIEGIKIHNTTDVVTMTAYGAGTATFSSSGVISSVSDENWKVKDGIPSNPDEMINKLLPCYWFYNEDKSKMFGKDRQLGFFAQNVNFAIGNEAAPQPETIITKAKDGTETTTTKAWGYYDRSILAVTVLSLQKALATINILTSRIETLEIKNV